MSDNQSVRKRRTTKGSGQSVNQTIEEELLTTERHVKNMATLCLLEWKAERNKTPKRVSQMLTYIK